MEGFGTRAVAHRSAVVVDYRWQAEPASRGGGCHLGPTELPAQLLEELSSGRFTYFVPFIFRTRKISAQLRLGQMSLFPRSRAA